MIWMFHQLFNQLCIDFSLRFPQIFTTSNSAKVSVLALIFYFCKPNSKKELQDNQVSCILNFLYHWDWMKRSYNLLFHYLAFLWLFIHSTDSAGYCWICLRDQARHRARGTVQELAACPQGGGYILTFTLHRLCELTPEAQSGTPSPEGELQGQLSGG